MKTLQERCFTVVFAFVAFWSLCNQARAAEGTSSRSQPVSVQISQQLSRYDANRNGRLDAKEREVLLRDAAEQRKAQRIARGKAAAESAKVAAADHYANQKVSPKLLEKYDANKNGKMDLQEWQKHRQDVLKARAAKLAASQQQNNGPASVPAPAVSQSKP